MFPIEQDLLEQPKSYNIIRDPFKKGPLYQNQLVLPEKRMKIFLNTEKPALTTTSERRSLLTTASLIQQRPV